MSTLLKRAQRAMFIVVAGILGLSLFAPMVALADTDLAAGESALISSGGAEVNVFADTSYDAQILVTVPNGTPITIAEAAVTAEDGTPWYAATVWDVAGFVPADVVSRGDEAAAPADEPADDEASAEEESSEPQVVWKAPVDSGVVVDNASVGALPAEGLACRASASSEAEVVVRFTVGQSLEVTGEEVWAEGVPFLPVNCAGQGGFVRAEYVQLASEGAGQAGEQPTDETPATDDTTDDTAETEDPASSDEDAANAAESDEDPSNTETPGSTATGTGDLIVTAQDGDGAVMTDACFQLVSVEGGEVVAESCDADDAMPGNGNTGFFGIAAGTYLLIPAGKEDAAVEVTVESGTGSSTSVTVAPDDGAEESTATTSETPDAGTEDGGADGATEESTDTTGGTPGAATEDGEADNATDDEGGQTSEGTEEGVETLGVTDEETGTDDATDGADETPDVNDENVDVEAEVGVTTDDAVGTPGEADSADPVETPDESENVDEDQAGPGTEETVATAEATAEVTAESSNRVSANQATAEIAETPDVSRESAETPKPTEAPATTAAESGSDATTRTSSGEQRTSNQVSAGQVQGQDASRARTATSVGTAVPESSKAIGSAEVQGTNGDGVQCRVGPDPSSAVISVLPEGTRVTVFAQEGRFLAINCGNQLGYGSVDYLWAGGAGTDIASSISTVTVASTGGGGLNCRTKPGSTASIIGVVSEGSVLGTRGGSANGWLPVVCIGEAGYVSIDYVNAGGGAGDSGADFASAATAKGYATVSGTNGDGVRCRSRAGTSGSVLSVIPEGTKVGIRGTASGGWTPIRCYGYDGYASSQFLSNSGGGSSDGGSGSGVSSGSVKVTGTGGGGLRCRSGAGMSAGIITVVSEGATLKVRGGASGGWQPVVCGGQNGFVSTDFISGTSGGGSDGGSGSTNGGGSSVVSWSKISGTNGDGVRCRSGASTGSSVIAVIPEGTSVGLRGSASGGWTPVRCYGSNGFVSSQFLSAASAPPSSNDGGSSSGGGLVNGNRAKLTDNVNLRYEPSASAGIATVVPAGTVVQVTGGINNGFHRVSWDGLNGYLHSDYLQKTSSALSERGGSAAPSPKPQTPPGGGGGGATGNAIVDYAMRYVGYPYVWATHGPSSFDCSGFTYWVAKNVLGIDIGTGTWSQAVAGKAVSKANLQPGDLVFFQNTYTAGLSHVGIYIGGGQFVHSENETTGVKVSDLNSSYYGSRWYGAVRLT